MDLLVALEAEKLTKQKWKQYCGTLCMRNIDKEVKREKIGENSGPHTSLKVRQNGNRLLH